MVSLIAPTKFLDFLPTCIRVCVSVGEERIEQVSAKKFSWKTPSTFIPLNSRPISIKSKLAPTTLPSRYHQVSLIAFHVDMYTEKFTRTVFPTFPPFYRKDIHMRKAYISHVRFKKQRDCGKRMIIFTRENKIRMTYFQD